MVVTLMHDNIINEIIFDNKLETLLKDNKITLNTSSQQVYNYINAKNLYFINCN
jgi:hypothetical protein